LSYGYFGILEQAPGRDQHHQRLKSKYRPGKTAGKTLNLNAGLEAEFFHKDCTWEIFGAKDADGSRKKLIYSYDGDAKLAIPAGKVLVVRSEGDKKLSGK
jgi:hypothetical protein